MRGGVICPRNEFHFRFNKAKYASGTDKDFVNLGFKIVQNIRFMRVIFVPSSL